MLKNNYKRGNNVNYKEVKRINDLYNNICIALFKLGCINQGKSDKLLRCFPS